jgi:hypothetical protein
VHVMVPPLSFPGPTLTIRKVLAGPDPRSPLGPATRPEPTGLPQRDRDPPQPTRRRRVSSSPNRPRGARSSRRKCT